MPKKPPRNNPRERERRTVQTAASVLQRITRRNGGLIGGVPPNTAAALIERIRPLLPETLRAHLIEVLEKPDELVLFVDSAAWAARLKLAATELAAVAAGRRQVVRVMPPGGMRR